MTQHDVMDLRFGYAIPGIIIDPRIEGRLPKYKTLMEDNVHQPIVPQYMASSGSIMSTKVCSNEALRSLQSSFP